MRFTFERLTRRIDEVAQHVYRQRAPQPEWRILPGAAATRALPPADDPRWRAIRVGEWWGQDDANPWAWFHRQVTVPAEWAGQRVALLIRLGESHRPRFPEALAYRDGVVRQGIDRYHDLVYLSEAATGGETFDIALEAWRGQNHAEERLAQAELVWIDPQAWDLVQDARVALEVARSLPEDDYARVHLLNSLEEAILCVDYTEPLGAAFYASLGEARQVLAERIASAGLPARHERVRAIGHAHIDVAWLWSLAQTREKAARTFSTVLRLMERYPDYHFIGSQAQLYQFIAEDHPELLDEIRLRAAEGRWEVNGATWVEMDTNVTGGESLVRQFLYGRRYFQEVLGYEGDVLWLPDVFGYSGALPQIIRRAGISYFMTTKISWNQYNRFPYDTFQWVGIDGTPVLTHFVTTPSSSWFYTYNGSLTPEVVKGTWEQNRSKDITDEILMTYGHGDGGGGPTAEMLEVGQRLANYPGAPRVVLGTANGFFQELHARLQGKPVPAWEGELYLEYHRGTLTSQAQIKRDNRKSEILFHQAEAAAAAAALLGAPYPAEALRQGWEIILRNQFHDIIPGSSIREVYEDSAREFARVGEIGSAARARALQAIAARAAGPAEIVVFNALGWARTDLVELPLPEGGVDGKTLVDVATGQPVATQAVLGGDGQPAVLALLTDVPAYGYRTYRWTAGTPAVQGAALRVSEAAIETPFLRLTLDGQGHFSSIYDVRAGREVLADGERGNVLQAFEDKPLAHDAWDIDIFYQDKMWEVDDLSAVRVLEEGPLRAVLELRRRFRGSTIVQRITAYAHTPRVDVVTEADWHERHTLLKVAFPVAVHAPRATYEIQFGALERPTHWNTSWDYARFEVVGHRWADLSEGNYGVSLLNDCKYGHDIKGHTMRLTLIKCATAPDPEADQGQHRFTYALYPHAGDWRSGTVPEAAALNDPLLAVAAPSAAPAGRSALPAAMGLVSCSANHVVIDTVKAAEDGNGLIVRVYEAYNQRGPAALQFATAPAAVWECNLMEENEQPLEVDGQGFSFAIKPFQIRTFRVIPAKS